MLADQHDLAAPRLGAPFPRTSRRGRRERQLVIELDDRIADDPRRQLVDDQLPRRLAIARAQLRGVRKPSGSPAPARPGFRSGPAGRSGRRCTISRQPGASVAISGLPHAAASSRLTGRPSRCEGSTARWQVRQSETMSSICPSQVMPGRRLHCSTSPSEIEVGLAGSGLPAISRLKSWPWLRRMLCAATSARMPLSTSRRPAKPKVIGPVGLGQGLQRVGVDAGARESGPCGRLDAER